MNSFAGKYIALQTTTLREVDVSGYNEKGTGLLSEQRQGNRNAYGEAEKVAAYTSSC